MRLCNDSGSWAARVDVVRAANGVAPLPAPSPRPQAPIRSRSGSLMMGPRAVLMRNAVRFILRTAAVSIRPRVCGTRGRGQVGRDNERRGRGATVLHQDHPGTPSASAAFKLDGTPAPSMSYPKAIGQIDQNRPVVA